MKTPDDVVSDLKRKVANTWHLTVTGDTTPWPLRLPVGKPTTTDLSTRFPDVQRWAIDWRAWTGKHDLELAWENRLVHGTRQPIPTHLTVPNLDSAARVLGGEWPARISRGRIRYRVLRDRFPGQATADKVRYTEPFTDTDFHLLCNAAAWFADHEATGLTPRQVPIEGLHGKWLNNHRTVITALSGKRTLGLIDRPTRVHFTYLDPTHLADGGRRHDSITIGDVARPAYLPRVALIAENKDTAIGFPPLPFGVAIEGGGFAAAGLLPQIPWLIDVPRVVYWGDIDAAGYEIVNRLRSNGVTLDTMLMGFDTYYAYEKYGAWTDDKGKHIACSPRKPLLLLTEDERRVYEALTDPAWTRTRRIEQERIPFTVAMAALTAPTSPHTLRPY